MINKLQLAYDESTASLAELWKYENENNHEVPDSWKGMVGTLTIDGLERAMEKYAQLKIEEYKNSDEALINTACVWWMRLSIDKQLDYCKLVGVINHTPVNEDVLKAWRINHGKE